MKRLRRLRVMKRYQSFGFSQSFDRNGKAHVRKHPADERGEEPNNFFHRSSGKGTAGRATVMTSSGFAVPLLEFNLPLIHLRNTRQRLHRHPQ